MLDLKDTPMCSRPATSSPLGKRDTRLDTLVDEGTAEKVAAMAAIVGITKGEYVRQIIERHVYGEFSMLQSVAARHFHGHGRNEG